MELLGVTRGPGRSWLAAAMGAAKTSFCVPAEQLLLELDDGLPLSQVTEELLIHEDEFLFRKWHRHFKGSAHQNAFLSSLSTAPGVSPEHHLLWDCSAGAQGAGELLPLRAS